MTIWTSLKLSPDRAAELESAVRPNRLVFAARVEKSNLVSAPPDDACRTAEVAFGQPGVEDVLSSTTLRWIHLSSAGYTRFDPPDVRRALRDRGCALTTSSGVYANPCAQHVLAMMLGRNRRLAESLDAQRGDRRWSYNALRDLASVLDGQSALLVGLGAIARRLAELLAPFHMSLAAVRRTVAGDEPVPTHPVERLDALLPWADHVINLLPSAAGNERLFDARRFRLMREGAAFYNVGRGDTVDQPALIEALQSGRLGAAYLDVTTPEPLPPDHPLWAAPRCFITPHIAGGTQQEQERILAHFLENLKRFEGGNKLVDRVI